MLPVPAAGAAAGVTFSVNPPSDAVPCAGTGVSMIELALNVSVTGMFTPARSGRLLVAVRLVKFPPPPRLGPAPNGVSVSVWLFTPSFRLNVADKSPDPPPLPNSRPLVRTAVMPQLTFAPTAGLRTSGNLCDCRSHTWAGSLLRESCLTMHASSWLSLVICADRG